MCFGVVCVLTANGIADQIAPSAGEKITTKGVACVFWKGLEVLHSIQKAQKQSLWILL